LDAPAELAGLVGPNCLDGVGGTGWISLLGLNVKEEEFVGSTDGSEIA